MHAPITNAGSAKRLEGNIYVITFFVSETDWPAGYKMELFKQMRDAESWLERMAIKYGKTGLIYHVFDKLSERKKRRNCFMWISIPLIMPMISWLF